MKNKMRKTMIEVRNVSMEFNLASEKVDSLKEYCIKLIKKQLRYNRFMALEEVSFNVRRGEVFGIIGNNGCGKSTILKIISGIYKPTTGTAKVYGSISPLIELGAGFDPELTGRENIYLNASILGYSKKYIDEMYQAIVDFSEIEEFIDVPIKNYSSGMVARIGFAIATLTKPDILIVDEILSVGDFSFQQKCEQRISELMAGGTTVIIVSHSLEQIERLCDRVVWLEKGRIKMIGDTKQVCREYKIS